MAAMMMVMATTADRLRQVLNVGQLTALRGIREIRRQLVELSRCRSVAIRGRGAGGALQIRRDLLRDLLIFGWVGLLELLQRAHQLRERRKLAVILRRYRRSGAEGLESGVSRLARPLECGTEDRLEIAIAEIVDRTRTHAILIGM